MMYILCLTNPMNLHFSNFYSTLILPKKYNFHLFNSMLSTLKPPLDMQLYTNLHKFTKSNGLNREMSLKGS